MRSFCPVGDHVFDENTTDQCLSSVNLKSCGTQEIDENNVGNKETGTLAHPFLSKVKDRTPISPRSKRLKELNDQNAGQSNPASQPTSSAAARPAAPSGVTAAPPAPGAPQVSVAERRVDVSAQYSPASMQGRASLFHVSVCFTFCVLLMHIMTLSSIEL